MDAVKKTQLDKEVSCALCGTGLASFKYRAMPEWNVDGLICGQCYGKKLLEHYIQPDRRTITKK